LDNFIRLNWTDYFYQATADKLVSYKFIQHT
jgi:hypothetical protein